MPALPPDPAALLLDIDGVLHVGDEPIEGAIGALERLREQVDGVLLVTNTTSKPRSAIAEHLRSIGFDVADDDVVTPAALAVDHCHQRGHRRVALMVAEDLREDLTGLEVVSDDGPVDAIVLGDLGDGFTPGPMNQAFRRLIDGAELVALQHNRYWRSAEGLVMDVGAWAAALEYASGAEPVVVGKPSEEFFAAALARLGSEAGDAVMVGDDVEGDVGGGLGAGIASVLVRTGKYRRDKVADSEIEPTATIDSIADLPALL